MGHSLPVPRVFYRHRCASMVLIQPFQTEADPQGQFETILWRSIRSNKEDKVARLEWAPDGGLGRAVIGKVRPSLPRKFPFNAFLMLSLDHRIDFLWPTCSAETRESPCVFRSVPIHPI